MTTEAPVGPQPTSLRSLITRSACMCTVQFSNKLRTAVGPYIARVYVFTDRRAVYALCTRPKTEVYTTRTQPCGRAVCVCGSVQVRVHALCKRYVHGRVYGTTRPVETALHGRVCAMYTSENVRYTAANIARSWTCTRPYNGRVHVYTCSWAV